jgi:hypothetical protein
MPDAGTQGTVFVGSVVATTVRSAVRCSNVEALNWIRCLWVVVLHDPDTVDQQPEVRNGTLNPAPMSERECPLPVGPRAAALGSEHCYELDRIRRVAVDNTAAQDYHDADRRGLQKNRDGPCPDLRLRSLNR